MANLLLKNKFNYLYNESVSVFLFIIFLIFNLFYFIRNFFNTFLNKNSNGDEYYQYNLYSISDITIEKIFSTPSQTYIFISSLVDFIICSPKLSTRLVSILSFFFLILYFSKRIYVNETRKLEIVYKITLFICAISITNQMFIGTSDFLSFIFIVFPFLIIIENIRLKKINLTLKQCFLVGILFALSVTTRPTSIILIFSFCITFIMIIGFKPVFQRETWIIFMTGIFVVLMINIIPLLHQNRVVLDTKEIPEEIGVNWFQCNYLMAKFWDTDKIPTTQWITTDEVLEFKRDNPNFAFPKNQFDLLLKEPGLYFRQMIRMFTKALYSSYRYMYLLFPLLFFSFYKNKKSKIYMEINGFYKENLDRNKFIIVFYLLSIIFFSFLAVKLFEFRWIIPLLIIYCFLSLNYLSRFPIKIRVLIYNLSFLSGILMYTLTYIKTL